MCTVMPVACSLQSCTIVVLPDITALRMEMVKLSDICFVREACARGCLHAASQQDRLHFFLQTSKLCVTSPCSSAADRAATQACHRPHSSAYKTSMRCRCSASEQQPQTILLSWRRSLGQTGPKSTWCHRYACCLPRPAAPIVTYTALLPVLLHSMADSLQPL